MRSLCLGALALALAAAASPASVTFDFTDTTGLSPDRSALFDDETSVTIDVMDLGSGQTANMTVTARGGTLNSNNGEFGVNTPDTGDDFPDHLDFPGEAIELSFDRAVELLAIDFGGIGHLTSTDTAQLTIGELLDVTLGTTAANFNGSSDTYTFPTPLTLPKGTVIELTRPTEDSSFFLQSITLNIVPEPASPLLAVAIGLMLLAGRARRTRS